MFELPTNDAQLLLEIALMAIGQNHFKSAEQLLDALEAYRPGHESLDTARAVLLLSARHPVEAIAFADDVALRRHPDNDLLKAFKGAALIQLFRKEEARSLLQDLQSSPNENAANMARGLLDSL